jgi:hypothetical protein
LRTSPDDLIKPLPVVEPPPLLLHGPVIHVVIGVGVVVSQGEDREGSALSFVVVHFFDLWFEN